jgi:hypothetical protein
MSVRTVMKLIYSVLVLLNMMAAIAPPHDGWWLALDMFFLGLAAYWAMSGWRHLQEERRRREEEDNEVR